MVLDDALLNTQHYKVSIKGKAEQSSEWGCAFPCGVVAIEKGAFGSSTTKVTNFTIYISYYQIFAILSAKSNKK